MRGWQGRNPSHRACLKVTAPAAPYRACILPGLLQRYDAGTLFRTAFVPYNVPQCGGFVKGGCANLSGLINEQLYGLALDNEECLWYISRNVYGRIGAKNMKYLAELGNIEYKQINADKHSEGPFSLARVNALHSQLNRYWPQGSGKLPATKYIDVYTMFFWWLQKRSNLTTEQKVDELYSYIVNQTGDSISNEQHINYDELNSRQLPIDTKRIWQLLRI